MLFIIGGILPVVHPARRMFLKRRRYAQLAAEGPTEEFTQTYEE